eukprot:14476977-Alexandrium_andersonii.AAC.1
MTFQDAVDVAADGVRRLGYHGQLRLKTDNEPALVDLRQGVADALASASGSTIPEIILEPGGP